jgi:hypothetical protein
MWHKKVPRCWELSLCVGTKGLFLFDLHLQGLYHADEQLVLHVTFTVRTATEAAFSVLVEFHEADLS